MLTTFIPAEFQLFIYLFIFVRVVAAEKPLSIVGCYSNRRHRRSAMKSSYIFIFCYLFACSLGDEDVGLAVAPNFSTSGWFLTSGGG